MLIQPCGKHKRNSYVEHRDGHDSPAQHLHGSLFDRPAVGHVRLLRAPALTLLEHNHRLPPCPVVWLRGPGWRWEGIIDIER